jgi:hypothetical protein
LKDHPDQDSYVKPSVVVDVMRKALQREEKEVAPLEETIVEEIQEEIVDGSNAGGENEGGAAPNGLIADEKNEGGAPHGQGTGPTARENNMKDGSMPNEEKEDGAAPRQLTEPTVASSEETQAQENKKDDGSNAGGEKEGGAAPSQLPEPTIVPTVEMQTKEMQKEKFLGSIAGGENADIAAPHQLTKPTVASSEKTKAQENKKDDGSMLVLDILKRQLSCVIDKRYKSVEEYVPKAILTLTPEEVKVMDAKKDLAAEDAIKSVIEMMQEDYGGSDDEDGSTESDDSWKVSRYRYSKDEVKCWFDSLKKCHAYDLGFAADPGTDDKKCWCPCW